VAAVAFCEADFYVKRNLMAKTTTEYGTNGTEEQQNLLYKTTENFQSKPAQRDFISTQLNVHF
jgi:hypothetical protein